MDHGRTTRRRWKLKVFGLSVVFSLLVLARLSFECEPPYIGRINNGMLLQEVQCIFGDIPGHPLPYNGLVMWEADERLFLVYFDDNGKVRDKDWTELTYPRPTVWEKLLSRLTKVF